MWLDLTVAIALGKTFSTLPPTPASVSREQGVDFGMQSSQL